MNSRFLFLTIVFFSIFLESAISEMEIQLLGEETITLTEQPVMKFGLLVKNNSRNKIDVTIDFENHEGLENLLPAKYHDVEGNSEKIILFAVKVQNSLPAGSLEYKYSINDSDGNSHSGQVTLIIPPRPELELHIESLPLYIKAGEMITTEISFFNKGNTPLDINLMTKTSDGSKITINAIDGGNIAVDAGHSFRSPVTIQTSKELQRNVRERLEIIASCSHFDLEEQVSASIEVIPDQISHIDPYTYNIVKTQFNINLEAKDNFTETPLMNMETDINAPLNKEGTRSVNVSLKKWFDLSNPLIFNSSDLFNDDDSYLLDFHGENLMISIGDKNRETPSLLHSQQSGRGVDARFIIGPFFGGGVYQSDANADYISGFVGFETRGFVNDEDKPRYSIQTGYMAPFVDSGIFTMRQSIRSSSDDYLTLEIAANEDNPFSFENIAIKGIAGITVPRFRLKASGLYTGKDFSLPSGDRYSFSGDVNFSPFGSYLSLIGNGRKEGDLLFSDSMVINGGLGLTLPILTFKGLYKYKQKRDLDIDSHFKGFFFNANLHGDFFQLNLQTEVGWSKDKLQNTTDFMRNYGISLEFKPSESFKLSFEGYYHQDNSIELKSGFSIEKDNFDLYGSSSVSTRHSDFTDINMVNYLGLNLKPEENYKLGLHITHSAERLNSLDNPTHDFALTIKYSRSFRVQSERKSEYGSLSGVILDENNRTVENVVLHFGRYKTISGSDGTFHFPTLAPGNNLLTIDRTSLDINLIPNGEFPRTINVLPARTSTVDIQLVKRISIEGNITAKTAVTPYLADFEINAGESRPMEKLEILLSNGEETLTTETDEKGNFAFSDIIPGSWTINIPSIPREENLEIHKYTINDLTSNILPHVISGGVDLGVVGDGDRIKIHLRHRERPLKVKMIKIGQL